VELRNVCVNVGANSGSEKLGTKKNTTTSGKLIKLLEPELFFFKF